MADASMDSGTAAPAGAAAVDAEARSGPERNSEPQITAPAPSLIGMSLIHGYTTGFWVGAAIFGAGCPCTRVAGLRWLAR